MASTLICRNVTVSGHRTSIRLEPAMWDALRELCRREELSMHTICSMIDRTRRESGLTAALRVYIVSYFRSAATEHGHSLAGHGIDHDAMDRDERRAEDSLPFLRREERIYDPV